MSFLKDTRGGEHVVHARDGGDVPGGEVAVELRGEVLPAFTLRGSIIRYRDGETLAPGTPSSEIPTFNTGVCTHGRPYLRGSVRADVLKNGRP